MSPEARGEECCIYINLCFLMANWFGCHYDMELSPQYDVTDSEHAQ